MDGRDEGDVVSVVASDVAGVPSVEHSKINLLRDLRKVRSSSESI